jgi:hypothetical protein
MPARDGDVTHRQARANLPSRACAPARETKFIRKGSSMTKSLPDRSGIAGVALPDRSPKTTNRSAMTNDPLAGRANPRTARGRRVRDLFRSLVARLPEPRDPIAEAQALKIAELTSLAEPRSWLTISPPTRPPSPRSPR